jgi:hypothetical protein
MSGPPTVNAARFSRAMTGDGTPSARTAGPLMDPVIDGVWPGRIARAATSGAIAGTVLVVDEDRAEAEMAPDAGATPVMCRTAALLEPTDPPDPAGPPIDGALVAPAPVAPDRRSMPGHAADTRGG